MTRQLAARPGHIVEQVSDPPGRGWPSAARAEPDTPALAVTTYEQGALL